jgi:hypothetical protein
MTFQTYITETYFGIRVAVISPRRAAKANQGVSGNETASREYTSNYGITTCMVQGSRTLMQLTWKKQALIITDKRMLMSLRVVVCCSSSFTSGTTSACC